MSADRIAISNIAWGAADEPAVAEVLRSEGIRGVEIAPTTRWADPVHVPAGEAEDYRGWWEAHGIRIVALQSLLFGRPNLALFGSPESREGLLDHLTGLFALAGRLGATALVLGSPRNRIRGELPIPAAMEHAAVFLTRVAERAEEHGVVLCVEPNPPQYGCDFVTTTAEAIELVERVGRPGVRLQGDLSAVTLAADSPAVLTQAARLMGHYHISEPYLAEIGTGGADHVGAAAALAAGGYGGWRSIEMRNPNGGEPAADRVRRAVEFTIGHYGR